MSHHPLVRRAPKPSTLLALLRASRIVALLTLTVITLPMVPRVARADQTAAPVTSKASATAPAASIGASASPLAMIDPTFTSGPSSGTFPMDATRDLASTDGASGAAISQVTFEAPRARGLAQPGLSLTYNSSSGDGEGGMGWSLGDLPSIERRALSGSPFGLQPRVNAVPGPQSPSVERYVYDGRELVEICTANADRNCGGAEQLPSWISAKWRYFRLRDDQSFARFFLSPDETTWRVGFKDGQTWELGKPIIAPTETDSGLEVDPVTASCGSSVSCPNPAFRWRIVRKFDLEGTGSVPHNLVLYSWLPQGHALYPDVGLRYLIDVYDTPDVTNSAPPVYAHRTHLIWEAPPYVTLTGQRIWHARADRRLKSVYVTSAAASSAPASSTTRQLVRRYHLAYTEYHQHSYLASLQLEGRCKVPPSEPIADVTGCLLSPPMTFAYSNPQYSHTPFKLTNDKPFSSYPAPLSLVDVNGDGLADFIEPAAATAGTQKVYFNALHGVPGLSADSIAVTTQGGANGTTLLGPTNISVGGEFRGNGTPQVFWYTSNATPDPPTQIGVHHGENLETGSTYYPFHQNGYWAWRVVPNDSHWFPQWNWNSVQKFYDGVSDHQFIGDIDGDGLVDGFDIGSSGNSTYGPWHATVRYSSRDDAGMYHPFDEATHQSMDVVAVGQWTEANVRHNCPLSGDFQDLADLNGDGTLDLYDIGKDGNVGFCPFAQAVYNPNPSPDPYVFKVDPDGFGQRVMLANVPALTGMVRPFFHDLDGDGYADLVWTTPTGIGFANSVDGRTFFPPGGGGGSWDPSVVPWSAFPGGWPNPTTWQVTFADMNGNGIDDIVVFNGNAVWFIDVASGTSDGYANLHALSSPIPSAPRGGLLLQINNGLGASTGLTYMSTADEQRRAAATTQPWTSGSPSIQSVVVRVTTTNGLPAPHAETRTTTYSHRDAIYDGWDHRLVGFGHVSVAEVGDVSTVGTLYTETTYLRGACADPYLDNCPAVPDDQLRGVIGLPTLIEKRDASTCYSTQHITYSVAQSYTGIDGRHVRTVTPLATDTWLYDPSAAQTGSTSPGVDVRYNGDNPALSSSIPICSATNQHLHTEQLVEPKTGNVLYRSDFGSVDATGASLDGIIRTDYTWSLYSPDNWTWRVHEAKVNQGYRDFVYEYDAHAHVTDVHSVLTGTLPLDLHHEDPNAKVAAQPGVPAEGSTVHTASYAYDPYGNLTDSLGAGGTCTHLQYTDSYALFPEVERHGCGSAGGLPITRAYDFGFEVATMTTTATGAIATAKYDELARIVEAFGPDPATGAPSVQLMTASYVVNPNGPLHSVRTTTPTSDVWTYLDGLGQIFLSLHPADTYRGDATSLVASGMVQRNPRGGVARVFEPWFYPGQPNNVPATLAAPSQATGATYDPMGRTLTATAIDGSVQMKRVYHALSFDTYTAADYDGTRTSSPSRVTYDGHGRTVRATAILSQPSADTLTTEWSYGAAGEVLQVTQSHQLTSDTTLRTMRYDSLGRLVLNAEPNTMVPGPINVWPAPFPKAFRYAYDSYGHLLGSSDARGCGKIIQYDTLGRLIAEDYSPCLTSQPAYTDAASAFANNEVVYTYDTPESGQTTDFGTNPAFLAGRLAAVSDRGAHTRFAYDGAGRLTGVARQLATPLAASGATARAYAPIWYRTKATYDSANRLVRQTTGADLPDLLGFQDPAFDGPSGASAVSYNYTARGVLTSISGSYGTLVSGLTYDATGLLQQAKLGDAAGTTEQFFYKDRLHRLSEHDISRGKGPWAGPWTPAPGYTPPADGSTLQKDLVHNSFAYDSNSNPTMIADARPPGEWADGAKPVTRNMTYDTFGRVTSVAYQYAAATTGDKQQPSLSSSASPVPSIGLQSRVQTQSFGYDWLGNLSTSDDDAHALYDRSLGTATTVPKHPNQLGQATMAGANGGTLTAQYDAAGNMSHLSVGRTCAGPRVRTCLSSDFTFDWDEVGQLLRARRWDSDWGSTTSVPAADLGYAYSRGVRVLKSIAYNGDTSASGTLYTAEIFNTLRLNHAHFASGDYERTNATETAYLGGIARVVFAQTDLPSASSGKQHVFFELNDEVGSTSAIIDKATGELVERSTSQIFGAPDSDYRTARWANFHEDFRFSGKEDDAEVGLTYSGARYYHAALQRFISADPLAIHALSGDRNPYAYAANSPLKFVDPSGLANGCLGREQGCTDQTTTGGGGGTPPVGQGGGGMDGLATTVSDIVDGIGGLFHHDHHNERPPPPPPSARAIIPPLPQPFHPLANQSLVTRWINTSNNGMAQFLRDDRALYRLQCNIAVFTVGAEVTLATGGILNALSGGSVMGAGASMSIRGAGQALLTRMTGTALGTAATGSAAALNASPAVQEVEETVAEHIALGLERVVEQQAASVGATHLMNDPNWKLTFMNALAGGSARFTVFLDNLVGRAGTIDASAYDKVMTSVLRNATGMGGATDFELSQLYQAGRLGSVTFMQDGASLPNPFQ